MSKFVVYVNIISLFISSIVKIGLILNEAPLMAFAYVVLFDSFILACGFAYFYLKINLSIRQWGFDRIVAGSLLKDSWPLMLGGMSFVIFSNIDNIMLKEIVDSHAVGVYSAAYKLVVLWYFLPGLILGSLMPAIVNAQYNNELFYTRIQFVSSLLLWIAIFVSVVYTIFNDYLVRITYGVQYQEAANLLTVLVWANVLIFFNSSWNKWMIVENKTKRILVFHFITAFINIILNLFLIRSFGALGAAYALLMALIFTYVVFFCYYKKMFYMFLSSVSFGKVSLFK